MLKRTASPPSCLDGGAARCAVLLALALVLARLQRARMVEHRWRAGSITPSADVELHLWTHDIAGCCTVGKAVHFLADARAASSPKATPARPCLPCMRQTGALLLVTWRATPRR